MHSKWRGSQEWRRMGMPLTTGSEEACKLYDAIVTQYAGWYDDPSVGGMGGTLSKLAAADPNFVMGQVVTNGLEALGTGRSVKLDSSFKADIDRMVQLAKGAGLTERERKHASAVALFADGYILGMHAFGLEEMNMYALAEEAARKALDLNPLDGWATHSICHVMEMTGRQQEGIKMMEETDKNWTVSVYEKTFYNGL
ncbi:tetratricopeptide repeat protein 38 [Plakobranchus ocellatus]|uniref:Tetratricopeptide repeat protein 38 n=1 Tax=Plakobranchus ocellatus TaxID=259542 RepID=A0AAV4CQ61_9GAST|nr:tetratricopeptide repeat protein 38 [Plakobranchus ocellatus]